MPRSEARGRASDALWLVGLGEERFRPLGTMSTGQRQRVKLAQAIAADPSLVLLDEPTDGLDPVQRDEMLALIRQISNEYSIDVAALVAPARRGRTDLRPRRRARRRPPRRPGPARRAGRPRRRRDRRADRDRRPPAMRSTQVVAALHGRRARGAVRSRGHGASRCSAPTPTLIADGVRDAVADAGPGSAESCAAAAGSRICSTERSR